jgi:thymidylate synthase ThyX
MSYKLSVKLLLYSESEITHKKIATFVITIPKFLQAQINSHRALSRNSGSSRAIPAKMIRKRVIDNPFIPVEFGHNQPGMRGGKKVSGIRLFLAKKCWLWARFIPCTFHYLGEKLNIHKEVLNRLIEPWMFTEVVLTATEWNNFIKLRSENAAQPEIQIIAKEIDMLLENEKSQILKTGQWHLPFISDEELVRFDMATLQKISVARCARVSYKLYDGTGSTIEKDVALCDRLIKMGHWSPFEHIAMATETLNRSGNFIGWDQYRKEFEQEDGGDY